MLRDAVHACWEATASRAVDFSDAWVAWLVADCRSQVGCHDHRQNASYALVNSTGFYLFIFRELVHGPNSLKAVKPVAVH